MYLKEISAVVSFVTKGNEDSIQNSQRPLCLLCEKTLCSWGKMYTNLIKTGKPGKKIY